MSLLNLPAITGPRTDEDDFNNLNEALQGDLLPRSSGVATDLAGTIGTETIPFLKVFVAVAPRGLASVIPFYDYNGLLSLPHGYMWLGATSAQITPENYNAQFQTGIDDDTNYWDLYVVSTPLENLYMPPVHETYFKASASTTDGSAPIAATSSNTRNWQHTHSPSLSSVNHVLAGGSASADYEATGSSHSHSTGGILNGLDSMTAQDIRPDTIECKYIMRIVQ